MTDMINHPAHYCEGRQYEPIDVISDWDLNYRLGCALKYIARAGRKDPSKVREDLQKCIWYIEREIASLDEPSPYSVPYEEVLTYYGESWDMEEAWPGSGAAQPVAVDPSDDAFDWDPSIGPVEISDKEITEILAKKDLDSYQKDEIVSTVERRGMVIGFRKDGSSCVIKGGQCQ